MENELNSLFERPKKETWQNTLSLSFQSLGVVYGHLSVAPLYVFGSMSLSPKEIISEEELYGLLSFIFWTLTLIPLLKYIFIVLQADDNGEGGTFALYSLLCRHAKVGLLPNYQISNHELLTDDMGSFSEMNMESKARKVFQSHTTFHYLLLSMALLGSCMVIEDGALNPALSVFSASSGLEQSVLNVPTGSVAVPLTCVILIGLFVLQPYGTHKIGSMFAPIVIIWLLFIGGLGLYNIFCWNHLVFHALCPKYMYNFMKTLDLKNWGSLSSILLCITGSEAMFADLGHFSQKSIKIGFGFMVYPSLVLCYLGQTAYLSRNLEKFGTHFISCVPRCIHGPFTVLAILASIVGSQAIITGTFSVVNQCLALGCFPRVKVSHTSKNIRGRVYIPEVNWILMALCLISLVAFRDIEDLGNAIGLVVITGMLITTCLMPLIITLLWKKGIFIAACFAISFGSIEALYFSACLSNFLKGAWIIVILSLILMFTMISWHYGSTKKYQYDLENKVSIKWLTSLGPSLGAVRVPGIGFIYTDLVTGIPAFFSHFIINIPAYHQVLVFVSFVSVPVPYIPPDKRHLIGRIYRKEYRVYRCIIRYGYRDNVKDSNDFEDQLIFKLGEFISTEDMGLELNSHVEGRVTVVGDQKQIKAGLIPIDEADLNLGDPSFVDRENGDTQLRDDQLQSAIVPVKRKKVRFVLPPESPEMPASVVEELQELLDARDSGTAYLLGHSRFVVRNGSNLLKKLLILVYIFLERNCRGPLVALDIPHVALLKVGTLYTI
ncbi:hypothetical protein AMTRI_Chr04g244500 [Amborella trichopoda]